MTRDWISRRVGAAAYAALSERLAPSDVWSVLLDVVARRAARRRPAELRAQWARDRFVSPAQTDPVTLRRIELVLFDAAGFEAVDLSPLAPLGVSSALGLTSQNKIVSTTRGTEVVSDPTNVLALECARRLAEDGSARPRLAACHRVVRAQPVPRRPGFSQHFALFALASARRAEPDHAGLEALVAEHVDAHLRGLQALRGAGWPVPACTLRLLAAPRLAHVAARLAGRWPALRPEQRTLEHPYYDGGLRFMFFAAGQEGEPIPLIDGGAFGWVARLTGHRAHLFVASGFGHQLVPLVFSPGART